MCIAQGNKMHILLSCLAYFDISSMYWINGWINDIGTANLFNIQNCGDKVPRMFSPKSAVKCEGL